MLVTLLISDFVAPVAREVIFAWCHYWVHAETNEGDVPRWHERDRIIRHFIRHVAQLSARVVYCSESLEYFWSILAPLEA